MKGVAMRSGFFVLVFVASAFCTEMFETFIKNIQEDNVVGVQKILQANKDIIFEVDPNTKSTALHHAALKGNVDIIKLLIRAGADVNAKNNNELKPFMVASKEPYKVNGKSIQPRFYLMGTNDLHWAVAETPSDKTIDDKLITQYGVDSPNIFGTTPLMYAALFQNKAIINQLLQAGADVNKVTDDGLDTALTFAIRGSSLGQKLSDSVYATIELLLQRGADANPMLQDKSSLRLAAEYGQSKLVELLLQRGAKPIDDYVILKMFDEKQFDVVSLLLAKGANAYAKKDDKLILEHAIEEALYKPGEPIYGLIRQLLALKAELPKYVETGARSDPLLFYVVYHSGSEELIKILLQAGAGPNESSGSGITPLSQAIRDGRLSVVELLLTFKVHPFIKLWSGESENVLCYALSEFIVPTLWKDPKLGEKQTFMLGLVEVYLKNGLHKLKCSGLHENMYPVEFLNDLAQRHDMSAVQALFEKYGLLLDSKLLQLTNDLQALYAVI